MVLSLKLWIRQHYFEDIFNMKTVCNLNESKSQSKHSGHKRVLKSFGDKLENRFEIH